MAGTCVLADVACSGTGGVDGEHMATETAEAALPAHPELQHRHYTVCNVVITEVWNV